MVSENQLLRLGSIYIYCLSSEEQARIYTRVDVLHPLLSTVAPSHGIRQGDNSLVGSGE